MNDIEDTITIEEMAEMHNVAPNTIRRILWSDEKLPESERRIPGAFKIGSRYRGEWRIPLESARAWSRDPRGRK